MDFFHYYPYMELTNISEDFNIFVYVRFRESVGKLSRRKFVFTVIISPLPVKPGEGL